MPRKPVAQRIKLSNNERINVHIACQNRCAHCGKHLNFYRELTIDHVIPLSKGGKNEPRNYVALCEECNLEKSNDIVYPMDYFPYLPKERQVELKELFDEYLKNTPWFAHDNLFMLDRFNMDAAKAVYMPKQGYCYPVPTIMRVEKTTPEKAFEYLQLYIARLQTEDKEMFVTSPEELKTPYYRVIDQDKTIMLISAYVDQSEEDNRNILRLDFFPNPDIKIRPPVTGVTLQYVLRALLHQIHATLMHTARNTIIDTVIMAPQSDKLARMALESYYETNGQTCHCFSSPLDDKDLNNGGTIGVQLTLYQGNYQDMCNMAKEQNVNSLRELAATANKSELQKPLDNALSQSRKTNIQRPKYTKHKNDAKKRARKQKRKKR